MDKDSGRLGCAEEDAKALGTGAAARWCRCCGLKVIWTFTVP